MMIDQYLRKLLFGYMRKRTRLVEVDFEGFDCCFGVFSVYIFVDEPRSSMSLDILLKRPMALAAFLTRFQR